MFTGCSFTGGSGWFEHADIDIVKSTPNKNSEHLWVNICHREIDQLKNFKLINEGVSGASNSEIFENTVANLSLYGNEIDTIICQWTSGPRYNFNCGLERWNTTEHLGCRFRKHNHKLSNGDAWSREYIRDISDRLLAMHHLHWEILKIVRYTNIIKNLTLLFDDIKVYFINGICPWDKNYFIKLENVLPSQYTEFTKKNILDVDYRPDDDIFFLYNKIHEDYSNKGGIDQDIWINLYDSFKTNQIDYNFDGVHPGKKSNIKYANMIKKIFDKSN